MRAGGRCRSSRRRAAARAAGGERRRRAPPLRRVLRPASPRSSARLSRDGFDARPAGPEVDVAAGAEPGAARAAAGRAYALPADEPARRDEIVDRSSPAPTSARAGAGGLSFEELRDDLMPLLKPGFQIRRRLRAAGRPSASPDLATVYGGRLRTTDSRCVTAGGRRALGPDGRGDRRASRSPTSSAGRTGRRSSASRREPEALRVGVGRRLRRHAYDRARSSAARSRGVRKRSRSPTPCPTRTSTSPSRSTPAPIVISGRAAQAAADSSCRGSGQPGHLRRARTASSSCSSGRRAASGRSSWPPGGASGSAATGPRRSPSSAAGRCSPRASSGSTLGVGRGDRRRRAAGVGGAERSSLAEEIAADKVRSAVTGGATRAESVRAGVEEVPEEAASCSSTTRRARSCPRRSIERVVTGAERGLGRGRAGPARSRTRSSAPTATPSPRPWIAPASSPCRRRRRSWRASCAGRTPQGGEASDCAGLVEAAGGRVRIVEGDPRLAQGDDACRPRVRREAAGAARDRRLPHAPSWAGERPRGARRADGRGGRALRRAGGRARGVDEIGFTEHFYYFRETEALLGHPYHDRGCAHRPRRTTSSAMSRPRSAACRSSSGWSSNGSPAATGRLAEILAAVPVGLPARFRSPPDRRGGGRHGAGPLGRHVRRGRSGARYFEMLGRASPRAASSTSLAHPDLVKIFGGLIRGGAVEECHEFVAAAIAGAGWPGGLDGGAAQAASASIYPEPGCSRPLPRAGVSVHARLGCARAAATWAVTSAPGVDHIRAAGYETVTVFEDAAPARSRSDERGPRSGSASTRTPSRTAPRSSSAASISPASRARRPLGRGRRGSRARRRGARCGRRSATSASSSPPDEAEWEDASSLHFLERAYDRRPRGGFELVNADCVLSVSARASLRFALRWSSASPARWGSRPGRSRFAQRRRTGSGSPAAVRAWRPRRSRSCVANAVPGACSRRSLRLSRAPAPGARHAHSIP